jgi:hypothetical protein
MRISPLRIDQPPAIRAPLTAICATAVSVVVVLASCAAPPPDDVSPGGPLDDGEACLFDNECQSNWCNPSVGCLPNDCYPACPDGQVCSESGNTRTCRIPPTRGETCIRTSDIGARGGAFETECAPPLICEQALVGLEGEYVCVPPDGDRQVGEPCTGRQCAEELECTTERTVQVCAAASGGRCVSNRDCLSYSCSRQQECE